jgi:hypothetical protein
MATVTPFGLGGRSVPAAQPRGRTFGGVEVIGLTELQRFLKDMRSRRSRRSSTRNSATSATRSPLRCGRVPVKTGRARASVKSGVRNGMAYVQGGKARSRTTPGLTSAGRRDREDGTVLGATDGSQVVVSSSSGVGYLYPTVAEMQPEIQEAAEEAFEDTARQLGLK